MKNKITPSTIVFSVLILMSSAAAIHQYITSHQWYGYVVSASMPDWLVPIRYYFSWSLRIFGIVVAVGLLAQREIFRKLGIWLGVFTLLTVYWKHHPDTFFRHTQYLTEEYAYRFPGLVIDFSVFAKDALIALYVFEFIFWGLFIFYFTRPSIKKHFR